MHNYIGFRVAKETEGGQGRTPSEKAVFGEDCDSVDDEDDDCDQLSAIILEGATAVHTVDEFPEAEEKHDGCVGCVRIGLKGGWKWEVWGVTDGG